MAAKFEFYGPESTLMAEDFATYLRCRREQPGTARVFDHVFGSMPEGSTILRNGAGTGDGVEWFLKRGLRVILAEPHHGMHEQLVAKFRGNPDVTVLADTVQKIALTEPVDGEEVRHLFYHVGDQEWGPCAMKAAARLSRAPHARLLITLKSEFTTDQKMLRHFRANKFKLLEQVSPHLQRAPQFAFEVFETNCIIVPQSNEDAISIARFMMCDRGPNGFPGDIDYREWESWVLRHLAARPSDDPWRHNHTHIVIRRNPYYELPTEAEVAVVV